MVRVDEHDDPARLADLADAVVGVVRQLRLPADPAFIECTPVEISVMRAINRLPGACARQISEATVLPSSNFSRVVRGLESKGLLSREVDERDARVSRLYPTDLARDSTRALHRTWAETLEGTVEDPATIELVVDTLRQIEDELIARRRLAPSTAHHAREQGILDRERR